jgi:hypothetical protein
VPKQAFVPVHTLPSGASSARPIWIALLPFVPAPWSAFWMCRMKLVADARVPATSPLSQPVSEKLGAAFFNV